MRRVIFAMLLMGFAAYIAPGQTSGKRDDAPACNLSVAQSPTIRGIRLGMSAEDLLALFPGSGEAARSTIEAAKRAPHYGLATLELQKPWEYSIRAKFEGVNQIQVQLFDGIVTGFQISYDGPPWNNVDEMVSRVSEALGLPGAGQWTLGSSNVKRLRCNGFEITIAAYGEHTCCSSIQLRTPSTDKQVQARRASEMEKAQRAFKP